MMGVRYLRGGVDPATIEGSLPQQEALSCWSGGRANEVYAVPWWSSWTERRRLAGTRTATCAAGGGFSQGPEADDVD